MSVLHHGALTMNNSSVSLISVDLTANPKFSKIDVISVVDIWNPIRVSTRALVS